MAEFSGFPADGLKFLADLEQHNNREWFEDHKQIYLDTVRDPALEFIEVLGTRLKTISDGIVYNTRTNGGGSLMRIYRDVRFSKDKSPYKTNVGIVFWEGEGKKMENPCFYFHMDATGAKAHAGMYRFDKAMLTAFREAVDDNRTGTALEASIAQVTNSGDYQLSEPEYKRVPRGYDADHPRADLLRHKGFGASSPLIAPSVITSDHLIDVVFDHFEKMAPLQQWLVHMKQNALVTE